MRLQSAGLSILLLWPGLASATSYVLADPADEATIEKVAETVGEEASTLKPLDPGALFEQTPGLAAPNGALERCTAEPTEARQLRLQVEVASDALDARNLHEAMSSSRNATVTLWCANELVSKRLTAKAYAVRGLAGWQLGSQALALEDLALAHKLDPELAWDDRWPDATRDAWKKAKTPKAAVAQGKVDVFPMPDSAKLWVDGESTPPGDPVVVDEGVHVVQVKAGNAIQTFEVLVKPNETTEVLLPEYVGKVAGLQGMAKDPKEQPRLAEVLDSVVAPDDTVYIPTEDGVLVHEPGQPEMVPFGTDPSAPTKPATTGIEGFDAVALGEDNGDEVEVVQLEAEGIGSATPNAAGAALPPPITGTRKRARRGLVATGLTLAVLGGATSVGTYVWGNQLLVDCEDEIDVGGPFRACPDNEGLYNDLRVVLPVAEATTGVGLGLAFLGLVLRKEVPDDRRVQFGPEFGAGYAGVRFRWTSMAQEAR